MNINRTTITAHQLTLTDAEIRASLNNPAPLLELLAASLLGAEGDGLGGVKDQPPKRITIDQARKAFKVTRHAKPAGARPKSKWPAKKPCPVCGKAVKYLKQHIGNKHPGYALESAAEGAK